MLLSQSWSAFVHACPLVLQHGQAPGGAQGNILIQNTCAGRPAPSNQRRSLSQNGGALPDDLDEDEGGDGCGEPLEPLEPLDDAESKEAKPEGARGSCPALPPRCIMSGVLGVCAQGRCRTGQ